MLRRSTRALAVAGCLAALTACGTTVPLAQQGAALGSDGVGQALPRTSSVPDAGDGTSTGGTTGLSSSTGTSGQVAPGSATGVGTSGAPVGTTGEGTSGSDLPATVRGMTASTVYVGYYYANTAALNAFAKGAGVNASVGDQRAQVKAVVDYINGHGGVAGGRKLVAVPYLYDITRSNDTNYQAMCSAWAEDNHVYAGLAGIFEGSGPVDCMAKRGALSIGTSYDVGSVQDFHRNNGYYYAPGAVETVTAQRMYVDALAAEGFFKPGGKIGLVYFDWPEYRTGIESGLKPALKSHGLTLTDSAAVSYGGNASELGNVSAAVQAAELKFASEGITEVLMNDVGGTLALLFMSNAQSQHVATFRYGLTSPSFPAFLEQQSGIDTQLPKSVAVGYFPGADTNDQTSAPGDHAERTLCLQLMNRSGNAPQSPSDLINEYTFCSGLFFLRDVLNRASSYTPAGFQQAAATLGGRSSSASLGDRFAPARPWGAAEWGYLPFNATCRCFRYVGAATPFA